MTSDDEAVDTDRFRHTEPCDEPGCDNTPTAWVGDIYYACEIHEESFKVLIS